MADKSITCYFATNCISRWFKEPTTMTAIKDIPTLRYPGVPAFLACSGVSPSQFWIEKTTAAQPIILS